jgi:signal transduction histidine kinase/CheY-like chemotaxis protein
VDESGRLGSRWHDRTISAGARLLAWLRAPIDAPSERSESAQATDAELPVFAGLSRHDARPDAPVDHAQAEAAVRHRAAASLRFLARASAELSETLNYDETLSRVTHLAVPELADWCTVDLMDDDGTIHRVAAAHVDPARESLLHETLRQFPIHLDEPRGVATALRTGESQIQPTITDEEVRTVARDRRHLQILQELRPRSHLIVPLISHGKRLGALSLLYSADSGRRYSRADIPLAEDLARRCAQAVENAQLYRAASEAEDRAGRLNVELERRVQQLRDANERLQAEMSERQIAQERVQEANLQLEHALDEVGKAQDVLRRQERLRALGELASGIAHDFNNALGMIVGFAELLLADPRALDDAESARGKIRLIHSAAIGAGAVVSRLRDLYRPREEHVPIQPVQLNDVIAQAISLTQPRWRDQAQAAGRQIRVESDVQPLPTVDGIHAELRDALANLILNATDAMPSGGTLTIRSRVEHSWVVIEIADTGIGMSPEVSARIFEPFFTTKGEHGTGLGLALVRGTVERHQGHIDVESAEGQGTTFTIRVPIGVTRTRPAPPLVIAPRQSLRVILAEDEPSLRRILASYLQIDGHEATVVADGHEALAAFAPGAFDLVITDRAMPEVNGDQVASEVKRLAPGTPVIMLTGLGDLMHDMAEQPEGVDLVVGKPVTLAGFREAIARVTA